MHIATKLFLGAERIILQYSQDQNDILERTDNPWLNYVISELSKEHRYPLRVLIEPFDNVYKESDPNLIDLIRQKYLIGPSKEGYNLEHEDPHFDTSMGQAKVVREVLQDMVSHNSYLFYNMQHLTNLNY